MPDFLGFFAGRRFVPIMTVLTTLVVCIPLYFVWPVVYGFLVWLGEIVLGMGAVGAGIYGFLNRLLIPIGMLHALNSVFWFDVAGINDIGKFWGNMEGGVLGQTGMYQACLLYTSRLIRKITVAEDGGVEIYCSFARPLPGDGCDNGVEKEINTNGATF